MQTCRPWDFGRRYRGLSLTVRFLLGGRGFSLTIPPLLMLLLLFGAISGVRTAMAKLTLVRGRQAEQMAELQRKNESLQSLMVHKEKEREQMVRLAELR